MSEETDLYPISIGELLDKQFFIRHYQRGYRWTKLQVQQMLTDIDSFDPKEITGSSDKTFYCLQPVVVRELSDHDKIQIEEEGVRNGNSRKLDGVWYEVVDGQQRLTTIFLIIQYINDLWAGRQKKEQFKIDYETRGNCVSFLKNIKVNEDNTSVDINKDNIDFYHISTAYKAIREWQESYVETFKKPLDDAAFQSKFLTYSKVIWYEVGSDEQNSIALFERLNLGKIPLTNAELTKALFLSANSFDKLSEKERESKQFEIAHLWDEIEHRLNEPDLKFWSFITNKKRETYDTKIELILDMISGKSEDQKDPLFTFLAFTKKQKDDGLSAVWEDIQNYYFTLLEWNNHRDLYHKIGFLVTAKKIPRSPRLSLSDLIKRSMELSRSAFDTLVENQIRESVKFEVSELRYKDHPKEIFNVLLLHNVETYRNSVSISDFYPFKQHKASQWSLEHIHARNSEYFDKNIKEQWLDWIRLHVPLLIELEKSPREGINKAEVKQVVEEINKFNNTDLTWDRFKGIFDKVNNILTHDRESMDRESEGLPNLALLSQPDNAALNNSVFEVKRREIIRLDKEGSFIPICTKRVFMKYHSNGVDEQHFYWSATDRKQYFADLIDSINHFLPLNEIVEEDEEQ